MSRISNSSYSMPRTVQRQNDLSSTARFAANAAIGAGVGAGAGYLVRMSHINTLVDPAKFLVKVAKNDIPFKETKIIDDIFFKNVKDFSKEFIDKAKGIVVKLVDSGSGITATPKTGLIKLPEVYIIFKKAGDSLDVIKNRIVKNSDKMISTIKNAAKEELPLKKYLVIGAAMGAIGAIGEKLFISFMSPTDSK